MEVGSRKSEVGNRQSVVGSRQKAASRKQRAESRSLFCRLLSVVCGLLPSLNLSSATFHSPSVICQLPTSDFRLPTALCFLLIFSSGCSKRDPEAASREALTALRAKLQNCVRASQPVAGVRLAVVSFSREQEEARVRLVAYNPATGQPGQTDGAVEFDAPSYLMSRGRWLINDSGRVYLTDQRCREYKLKNRQLTLRQSEAKNGRIRLEPGAACEMILSFARLPDDVQDVLLVYGTQVLNVPPPQSQP